MIDNEYQENHPKSWYRRKLHRAIQPLNSHLYSDGYWKGIEDFREIMHRTFPECDIETWVENGGYRNYFVDGDDPLPSKEWNVKMTTPEGHVLEGKVVACSAGTVDDPFKHYDMVVEIW